MAVATAPQTEDDVPAGLFEVPLFPLGTVLFPGGRLPLQIFEPRYVDMVRHCVREDSPFAVVLIREGNEARKAADEAPPEHAAIGTLARIRDFTELPSGLLGITVEGEQRVRVHDCREQHDHLLIGRVERLADPPPCALPDEYGDLQAILTELLAHPVVRELGLQVDPDDGTAVASVLTDLLPLDSDFKQELLEVADTGIRLASLESRLRALQQAGLDA